MISRHEDCYLDQKAHMEQAGYGWEGSEESRRDDAEILCDFGATVYYLRHMRARIADLEAERDDLLAACETALRVMTGPEYGGAPGTTDAVLMIREAVAKARGGEE